jgi:hypothetical protein
MKALILDGFWSFTEGLAESADEIRGGTGLARLARTP